MLATLRKAVELPRLRLEATALAGTILAFFWLLAKGFIQPIAVYLLELYLVF